MSDEAAENRIVQGHASCPASKPWALVAKSTGRVLGCHESRAGAVRQEQAIKAHQDGVWITRAQMATLCASCADEMAKRNLTDVNLAVLDELPPDLRDGLAAQVRDPGFFRHCVETVGADKDNPEAFCAWLHKKLTGIWPAEHARHVHWTGTAKAVLGRPRTATFMGRTFRVVPAVLVRSQVLRNNLGTSFLPADEITDAWAEMWNGIPVLVGEHPRHMGESISGRSPELWDARVVGWIFNAKVEQESASVRKLVGEVWLDESRAAVVTGFQAVLDHLAAGDVVELSTGFPTQTEPQAGQFGEEAYELVMHPVGADHLVISVDMTGACSVRHGCGLGAQEEERTSMNDPHPKGLLHRIADWLSPRATRQLEHRPFAAHVQRLLDAWNEMHPSDQDRHDMLRAALKDRFGGADTEIVVADVFSDTREVVFWFSTPMGPIPRGAQFFRTVWTETADHKFTFAEPERVIRHTAYTPVSSDAAPAASAAGNTDSQGEEHMSSDTKDLTALTAQVGEVAKTMGEVAKAVATLTQDVTQLKEAAKTDPNPAIAGLKQSIADLAAQFRTMKGVTESAVAERERERQELVRKLVGHYRIPFGLEDLEAKPIEELRKLQQMVETENWAGRGGPSGGAGGNESVFMEPVPYFKKQEKKGGEE